MAEFKKIFDGSKWNLHLNGRYIGEYSTKEFIERAIQNIEAGMDEDYIDCSSLAMATVDFTVPLGEHAKPQNNTITCTKVCGPKIEEQVIAYNSNYVPPPILPLPRQKRRGTMLNKKVVINKTGKTGIIETVLVDEHENLMYEVAFDGYSSENFFARHEFRLVEEIRQEEIQKTHRTTIMILSFIILAVFSTLAGFMLADVYASEIQQAMHFIKKFI